MTPFHWKVVGTIALLLVAGMTLRCWIWADQVGRCVRGEAHSLIGMLLHVGSWAIAIWLGVEAARASKRPWVGWVVGILAVGALGFFLSWAGFELSSDEFGDDDWNYRR